MTHDQTAPAPVDALKPCPFCGGDGHMGEVRYSKPLEHVIWEDGDPVTEAFFGHCGRCSSTMRNLFFGGYRTREQAIAAWNTRHTAPAGEVVTQWRRIGSGPWWDGLPDHEDRSGPYETRTLYTHPAPPADLVGLVTILHQYRSDMLRPPASDSRERRVAMIDAAIAKFGRDA